MNILGHAIKIAATVFRDKTDKSGQPYILHCIRVMMNPRLANDPDAQCAAILHDVLEDCEGIEYDAVENELAKLLPAYILHAVHVLSHDPKDSYDDYIKKISMNPIAKRVKLADLEDNSQISRLKSLHKKDFDRIEKYHRAYIYLSE